MITKVNMIRPAFPFMGESGRNGLIDNFLQSLKTHVNTHSRTIIIFIRQHSRRGTNLTSSFWDFHMPLIQSPGASIHKFPLHLVGSLEWIVTLRNRTVHSLWKLFNLKVHESVCYTWCDVMHTLRRRKCITLGLAAFLIIPLLKEVFCYV